MESPSVVPPGSRNARCRTPARARCAAEALELGALPGPLDALEDDQPPAPLLVHPSVMMGLAAPFRMPSRIHWFTCTITLSKFSFVTITRW